MLFKRKYKLPLWRQLREVIWPSSGWTRTFKYIKHRLIRLPHSTHDIAMGLAAGCVVSWTPTWGFQIFQCFIFCKIFRASFIASVLGTTFGNPWTFPILIWIAHLVGSSFIDVTGLESYFDLIGKDAIAPDEGKEYDIMTFVSMLIGGYIMAFLTFPIFYYSFYYMLEAARAAKTKVGHTANVLAEKVHVIKEHRQEKKEGRKEEKKSKK